jgi:hypothetical protein
VEHVRLFKFSKGIDCGEVWASDLKTRKESIRWDRDMSIKEGWENLDEVYKYHRKYLSQHYKPLPKSIAVVTIPTECRLREQV